MAGLLGFVSDPQARAEVRVGLLDAANRGVVAGLLGGPVDLATLALRPFGYRVEKPVGGSEWIGQKMQDAGMVSAQRNPLAEALAGVALPGAAVKAARGLSRLADLSPQLVPSASGPASWGNQMGVISPEGKARLLADLQAGRGSGAYRLGDVTQGQANQLRRAGLQSTGTDVRMSDDVFRHLHDKRVHLEGFTPEETVRFAEQAMAKRARVDFDPGKARQQPSLLNEGLRDPVTGKRYDARMPFEGLGDAFGARSAVPDGLPPRKK